ncbi:MAG: DUF1704 domain-containing protein [Myxococcales bacterium]|nr:DUF1704 domain-containing protein [Myxococcales bacterium]
MARRVLGEAAARIRLIGCATPRNLAAELELLAGDFAGGVERAPAFAYTPPPELAAARRLLGELATRLAGSGPLGALYAARAEELELEAHLCEEVGRPAFFALARRRYAPRDAFDRRADALADAWLGAADFSDAHGGLSAAPAPDTADAAELVRSDDTAHPGSLFNRLRAAVGAERLAVRVVAVEGLAALAATGPGVVFVERGRWLSRRATERTVVHELRGHVAPRERALAAPLGLFGCGTARGSDDQEGRALALEQAAGWLDAVRRSELALRHRAARHMEEGATFVDTVQRLAGTGAPLAARLRVAARAHRGGGLGRERVYLPAYLRATALLRERPELAPVLGCGRVACEAAEVLAPWVHETRTRP